MLLLYHLRQGTNFEISRIYLKTNIILVINYTVPLSSFKREGNNVEGWGGDHDSDSGDRMEMGKIVGKKWE